MPSSISLRLPLALACLVITTGSTRASWSTATPVCSLKDTRIGEASGLAVSCRYPGVFYLHNDSGDAARFFAVNKAGRTLATVNVTDAEAVDWEDMAGGTYAGRPVLFLADIGDNMRARPSVTVYMVAEPTLNLRKSGATRRVAARAIRFRYPDAPRNSETLLYDSRTKALYVVTKEDTGPSLVFRVAVAPGETVQVAKKVGEITLTDPLPMYPNLATGGDISPDGSRMVVRSYQQAYEWDIPPGKTVADALKNPPRIVTLPAEQQGEAIGYGRDNRHLMTVSEGLNPVVWSLRWEADR